MPWALLECQDQLITQPETSVFKGLNTAEILPFVLQKCVITDHTYNFWLVGEKKFHWFILKERRAISRVQNIIKTWDFWLINTTHNIVTYLCKHHQCFQLTSEHLEWHYISLIVCINSSGCLILLNWAVLGQKNLTRPGQKVDQTSYW